LYFSKIHCYDGLVVLFYEENDMLTKLLVSAVAICVCGSANAGSETPGSVRSRMDSLIPLFQKHKADTFKLLNGQDLGGASSDGKGSAPTTKADTLAATRSGDADGEIFCARATGPNNEGSEWASYPDNVSLVGTDARAMTDVDGQPIVPRMVNALRASPDRKEAVMTYAISVKDPVSGNMVRQDRTALIYGSQKLDPGRSVRKFVCAASWPTNTSDGDSSKKRGGRRH
jgi:hypothetical protein